MEKCNIDIKKSEIIKIGDKRFKKTAFMVEEEHPAVGRILIIDGEKFKVMNDYIPSGHRQGTFIARMTPDDEERIEEYDTALELLSEKLLKKVDIKRIIRENLKSRDMQDIRTGLYILEAEESGKKIDIEHTKGCYQFTMHYGNQVFTFATGSDVSNGGSLL